MRIQDLEEQLAREKIKNQKFDEEYSRQKERIDRHEKGLEAKEKVIKE